MPSQSRRSALVKLVDVTEFYSERGGGVRSHLSLKTHVLCQLGHEHVVVAPGDADEEIIQKLDPENPGIREGAADLAHGPGSARLVRIAGPRMPYDSSYHLLYRVDKIVARIAREKPDVLEIHSPYVAAMGAMSAPRSTFGVRTMQWHSDFIDTYAGALKDKHAPGFVQGAAGLLKMPLWAWVRAIGRACDAVVVSSRWQQEKLSRQGVKRVALHPFGIDKSIFNPSAKSESRRAELLARGSSNNVYDTLIVGVGRFAVEKRWDVVLDAFKKVASELLPDKRVKLVLFGDGPEKARMLAQVEGRDDVAMMGFVTDRAALASALASADLLVHGCPYETFGLGVAEALACGLPAVVPDEGGAAELVNDACGAHYRTGDSSEMAAAIKRVLYMDRAAASASAVVAASSLPTVQGQFERQIELYRELTARRSSEH